MYYTRTKDMSEMRESHGWNLFSSGRKASSHKGHKTGVSVLDALTEGEPRSKSMEWMLVTDEILVAHYGEREHIVTPFLSPNCLNGCDFRGKAIHCD